MPSEMEFRLLGPLEVRRDGEVVPLAQGMQRTVLAALLLNAGRVVPVEYLVETLWGCSPPPSAQVTVRNYVKRLRHALGESGARISTEPPGYRFSADPGELDVSRFEALLLSAREACRAGAWSAAADRARTALALWRGEPLADVPSEFLASAETPRLIEMRLQATEVQIDADLRLGRQADVIIGLQRLTADYPLREHLYALLMLALYRDGRQAEALDVYHRARRVIVDELGTEPGVELRTLQGQILSSEVASTVAQPARVASRADILATPRQLPAAARYFVGREREMAQLSELLRQAGEDAAEAPVIAAIWGTAGVGKTALAVHWARQVAGQFPDGQLHVDLAGFGASGEPVTPSQVMRLFLDGLGVAAERIPADAGAQAALFRSLLAGKRMLIVLDNARDPGQVRPLLPGSAGCLVLITSRNELTGLAAADGAHLLALDVLTQAEAHELLARRLGQARATDADASAAAELIALCARLPLALSVASARAAARPNLPLAVLTAELRDTRTRLDGLATGDAATDMRAVLSWSCRQLSEPAARIFALIGVHPGPDITVPAAASLTAVSPAEARLAVAELTRASLLTEHSPGRYACHDLLRVYAAEEAASLLTDAARRDALHRLFAHYLHTGYAASRLLNPGGSPFTLVALQPGVQAERLSDRQEALNWYAAERQVLVGVIDLAAAGGFAAYAWQLPRVVAMYFYWHGYWQELSVTEQQALTALVHLGDLAAQIPPHRMLAVAKFRLGRHPETFAHLDIALELGRELGSSVLQAQVQTDLVEFCRLEGRGQESLEHAEESLRLYRAAGDRSGEAKALNNLGWLHIHQDSPQLALAYCRQALVLLGADGDRYTKANFLHSIGYAHHHLGHEALAIAYYQQAIQVSGQAGSQNTAATVLTHLGDAHQAAGHPDAARRAWQRAIDILDDLGDPAADQVRARLGHPAG